MIRLKTIILLPLFLFLAGCDDGPGGTFTILAGSENRTLEPLVREYCEDQDLDCQFSYQGSLDIGLAIAGGATQADAVWPANSIWIDLYDRDKRVRDLTPVMRSPVLLGVRLSKARELGWIGKPVSSADIVAAVGDKKLTYLATSATQSNSGAGAYIAMLSAALGNPDAITAADLDRPEIRETVRKLLSGVARTAGSSGWLADLYMAGLDQGTAYDAMWNYEAVLAEVNGTLKTRGAEPLYMVYPTDGVAFANSPLGFIDQGRGENARAAFDGLLKYLLSAEVQKRIVALGRRPAIGDAADGPKVPDWNFDTTRLVSLVRMPEPAVVARALNLYQDDLRKPSLTVYCLDFSGSMSGQGEEALQAAMKLLLTPDAASPFLIQSAASDRIVIIPFDQDVRLVARGTGTPEDQRRLLDAVQQQQAGGGTDIYSCATQGLGEIAATPERERYLPAIVIMTDGRSDDRAAGFMGRLRAGGEDIPVFGITFGSADVTQLDALASATRARVFDGTRSLTDAFRAVRGYN